VTPPDLNIQNDEPAVARARLLMAYNGSAFHGFALNPGVPTVAGSLAEALSTVSRMPVEVVGAGRTDAGVHARGQVVSCDIPASTDLNLLIRQLNAICGPSIVVREASWASADFHARFSAQWRHYKYTVLNSPVPDPFIADTAWHVHTPLNLAAMQMACDPLIGVHDFSSFCRRPKVATGEEPASMSRYVMQATWHAEADDLLVFEIRANAFCHQMVRSIVGTLVEVGMGKRRAGDIRGILLAGDRSMAATIAPPHGLCLHAVGYAEGT
jgi:tRNA pseudouridine38-40 synthase